MTRPTHDPSTRDALRNLPAVDHVLGQPAVTKLLDDHPRNEVVAAIRGVLDDRRAALRAGRQIDSDIRGLALDIRQRLYERARPRIRRVINATGIVLHTNLGRAPLPTAAIDAIVETAGAYCNLELDLESGRRGDRHEHLRGLLRELTGAEDALVVNNNAAATYLTLNTLAAERDAIISRGQLVEIGGSYRLPDIMAAARCRMVEVGTTNRTRIADYERALSDQTAMLLRVHCSNYRIEGFTESASLAELVDLGRRHGVLVIDDLGSGLITDQLPWPAPPDDGADDEAYADSPADWDEPTVHDSVARGADLTLFSGDKLLGGPQAGIIVGRADLVAALRKSPLARAFRPGKLTLAALEATVRLYRDPAAAVQHLPGLRMLARTPAELKTAAHNLADRIADAVPEADVTGEEDFSEAGGGSLAGRPFPTWVVSVALPELAPTAVSDALRRLDLPVICRIRDDALVFDPRTLLADEPAQIAAALAEVVRELSTAE